MFPDIWILHIILSSLLMCVSLQVISTAEFKSTVSLFNNGTVKDTTEIPYCENKQIISLSSYNLIIKQTCSDLERRCRFQENPMSPESVIMLHDRCSFRRECDLLNFETEVKGDKNVSLHAMVVRYHCLGEEERLYEMCEDQAETVHGTVHLITGKSAQQYSACQCLLKGVNDSIINVTLKDIRLYSIDIRPRKCSESVLKIDENIFTCNETSSDCGSIFNEALPTETHNEAITVSLDFKDPEFDMVWLRVETQGSMSVECTGKRSEVSTTYIGVYNHPLTPNIKSDFSSKHDSLVEEGTTLAVEVICAVVCSVVAVMIFAAMAFCFKNRRKAGNTAAQCQIDLKHDNQEETSELEEQWGHRSENIKKANNGKIMNFRCRLLRLICLLFDHKSIKSRQNPQLQMPDDSKIVLDDKDVFTQIRVNMHTHLADTEEAQLHTHLADTEEAQLSDEIPMSDFYDKAITTGPVQESGQEERDNPEEKRHAYALLYHSLSKDGDIEGDENNIYNKTQFDMPKPQRNLMYNHLPIERFPMT